MDYKETEKAARKFEAVLYAFMKNYLDKYPTPKQIDERIEMGEYIFIDYQTLTLSIEQKNKEKENENHCSWRYDDEYYKRRSIDLRMYLQYGIMDDGTYYIDRRDTNSTAYNCVSKFISKNNIENPDQLPEYLQQTPEEKAEELAKKKAMEEEQERIRIEKERVKAEHKFDENAELLALIIPDIHGRVFWKDAVKRYPTLPTIFIGDYLDPYHNYIENISEADAFENFKEILKYKRQHPYNVILLFGNHDLHYFTDFDCSRKDNVRATSIRNNFDINFSLFKIAVNIKTDGPDVLISHAGILPGWLDKHFPEIDKTDVDLICFTLNDYLRNYYSSNTFINWLVKEASWQRGGGSDFGSPVWADIDEHKPEDYMGRKKKEPYALPGNIYQVFGHTQQEEDPKYMEKCCCIDCRRAFLLTKNGLITEMGD